MTTIDLKKTASEILAPWHSSVLGHAGGANVKVLRMDAAAYPEEIHDFDEALLVIDGQMNLSIGGAVTLVRAGEIFFVPARVPHGVATGSHGTLVIIDS